jgi:exosome complex RNA-binding protein Rrp42 (RNase PH superfamily)
MVSIKAETCKPLESEEDRGQIIYFLESSQTGTSLFTREDKADQTKQAMSQILNTLYKNVINRGELMIFKGEFAWLLNVDILVFDELALH